VAVKITAYCGPGTLGLGPHEVLADGAFDNSVGRTVPLTDDTTAVIGSATVDAVEINEDRRSVHIDLTATTDPGVSGLRRALRAAGITRLITEGTWSPGTTPWATALTEAAAHWRPAGEDTTASELRAAASRIEREASAWAARMRHEADQIDTE
jgi:hypothetical protein